MLGTIISAVAYGIVVMLSLDCFKLLFRRNITVPSRPMRRFLVFFISFMLLLSTLALIQGVLVSATSVFRGKSFPSLSGGAPFVLPLSIWASDGFMLWRCAVLYQGISRTARVALLSFISLVFLAALGSGISLFVNPLSGRLPTLLIISFSTLFNVIICVLIVVRLIFHQIYLRSVLGPGHGSPYTRIMAMTVESAALLIILGIPYVFLVAYQNSNGSMFVLLLLPQICAISPLLIVYRVAQGRAAMQMPAEEKLGGKLGSLHFDSGSTRSSSPDSLYISGLSDLESNAMPLPP